MPRCPNCNYILVLLKYHRKYKCAKCSRLFSQKEIDTKEFSEYNKKERAEGKKQYKRESDLNSRAKTAIPKIIYDLKNPKPKKSEAERQKEYRDSLSEQEKKIQNEKRKARRIKNWEATRVKGTIEYWRMKQKRLALKILEF